MWTVKMTIDQAIGVHAIALAFNLTVQQKLQICWLLPPPNSKHKQLEKHLLF